MDKVKNTHRWHFQSRQAVKHTALVLQVGQILLKDVIELVGDCLVIGAVRHALLIYGFQALVVHADDIG